MNEFYWQGKSLCKGPGVGECIPGQIHHRQPGTVLVLWKQSRKDKIPAPVEFA